MMLTNYDVIKSMSGKDLRLFLDVVYCAGLNIGGYAATLPEGEQREILSDSPFNDWIFEDAEEGFGVDGNCYCKPYLKTVMKAARIKDDEN